MADKFLGLQYPLTKTPRGILAQKKNIDQVKADLLQLLLTTPGERVMMPFFGTALRELFFEPNDPVLMDDAKRTLADAIQMWEPRIVVTNITITNNMDKRDLHHDDPLEDVPHILGIKIEFVDPSNITEVEELVLELPTG